MIIKLPTVNEHYDEDKDQVVKEYSEISFNLDLSAYAEERFEKYFRQQLNCSFIEYAERIAKVKGENQAKANYLSVLKLLYCYLESDSVPTFKEFIRLFHPDVAPKILEKVAHIIQLSKNSVVKN